MLEYLVDRSVRHRWLVLLAVAALAAFGAFNYQRLPIDAVPDITNVQVQINTEAPGLLAARGRAAHHVPDRDRDGRAAAPRVHALALALRPVAGHGRVRGRHRHLLRAPARQRTPAGGARDSCRPASSPSWARSRPAWARSSRSPLSADARRHARRRHALRHDATCTRSGLGRPAAARARARRHRGQHDRRLRAGSTSSRRIRPTLLAFGLTLRDLATALERNNANVGAGYIERNGNQYLSACRARSRRWTTFARSSSQRTTALPVVIATSPRSRSARNCAPAPRR